MEIEITNLKIIFKEISYRNINNGNLKDRDRTGVSHSKIGKEIYMQEARRAFCNKTEDEMQNTYHLLEQSMFDPVTKKNSVFNAVMALAEKLLIYDGEEIRCKVDELLRWREVSFQLGEDLLTCAFLAAEDLRYGITTKFFAWKPIIRSDDDRLYNILDRGMAENHFHLAGSTKIFELNWICLMNLIEGRLHDFRKISRGMQTYTVDRCDTEAKNEDLYTVCQRAAILRCYLFCVLKQNKYLKEKAETLLGYTKNSISVNSCVWEIQDLVILCKNKYGAKITDQGALDYALEKDMIDRNDNSCRLMAGERRFLYECYRAAKTNQFNEYQKNCFYKYLMLRVSFRGEMIQINERKGFSNFEGYQSRKEIFIEGETAYEDELVRIALNETLRKENIRSLEARICPKKHSADLYKTLYHNERIVKELENKSANGEDVTEKLIYVLHFPKIHDEKFYMGVPRNNNARMLAFKQMRSTVAFLEKETRMNKYIRGIDTCASELDCRPEVYAQIYRYMSNVVFKTSVKGKMGIVQANKKLRLTYHVGEDFLDIVDGLRAIDEVLLFCGLGRGSRLGHALALGIDPDAYYKYKNKKLVLSKQILLDDLAWLLVKAEETGCRIESQLNEELKEKFYYLYTEIYGKSMVGTDEVSCMDYYQSWKLRGDNPQLYLLPDEIYERKLENPKNELQRFDKYAFNDGLGEQGQIIRKRKKIRKLYRAYHYSESVREKGNEQAEFKVDERYADVVRQVQDKMIAQLVKEGIAIETNPSSNYLIGTIQKYDEHPILRFNSRKLKETERNMSLNVSINTDDQGVFDTLLENEYALMTLALKKKKDKDNHPEYDIEDIYEWIDYVRQMGLEQSFK